MKKYKKILAVILGCVFIGAGAVSAYGAVDLNTAGTVTSDQITGWPAAPAITSDTAVVMDNETGRVLYDKGADLQRYPASITKLMTLLVAAEHSAMDEQVTFTATGVRNVNADSSNIGTQVGEIISMEDCLYALILSSANDVAAQIAEHIGGTEQAFIDMMNQKAAELGCENTHFANSSGLPDENNYSSARDMALIYQAGLKNDTFSTVVHTRQHDIQPTNMNSQVRNLSNHHAMMAPESEFYYEPCKGGKTGYTNAAGQTLVTEVEQNGLTYIIVTMRAQNLSYSCMDTKALSEYVYTNFTRTEVNGGSVTVPNGMDISTLTTKPEENNPQMEDYYLGDHLVGSGMITVTETPVPGTEENTGTTETTGTAETTETTDTDENGSNLTDRTISDNSSHARKAGTETSDAADTRKDTVKGIPKTRLILLVVMAAMILLLIGLLAALRIKQKNYEK